MLMKNSIVLILLILASVLSAGNAFAEGDVKTGAPPDEFPIFPWDTLGSKQEVYFEAKDCGCNVAGFVAPENLDKAHAAGLKAFVLEPTINLRTQVPLTDEEIKSVASAVVSKVDSHPAVIGYHLIDEPDRSLIPYVAKWVRAFQECSPKGIAFVNLFPYFERGNKGITYEDYLTSFTRLAQPRALSYDNYTLIDNGTIRDTFFMNFEMMRKVSQKAGVPFWFIGLANAHFNYTEPRYSTFEFQMNTALAYGARGMGWFTYLARDRGNYRFSSIDFDGRKTPTWDMLRAANRQIHNLAPVYLKLKSVNVFHHPDVPMGCRGIDSSLYLKEIKGRGPFLVGEFEHPNGKRYFLIVNRNLAKSTSYEVVPVKPGNLMKVSSYTGNIGAFTAENNWLAPGQGMLLFFE